MKNLLYSLSAVAVAAAGVVSGFAESPVATGHPDVAAWPALFKADLSDASFKNGVWTVADGVMTASEDEAIWTTREYENFTLDLEFKTADGTNSGVLVYATDTECGGQVVAVCSGFRAFGSEEKRGEKAWRVESDDGFGHGTEAHRGIKWRDRHRDGHGPLDGRQKESGWLGNSFVDAAAICHAGHERENRSAREARGGTDFFPQRPDQGESVNRGSGSELAGPVMATGWRLRACDSLGR
jgi:hypothetical protein